VLLELNFIDGIINSQMYCSILKEMLSLCALDRRALDNDPKHDASKVTVGFLKKNRVKVIQRPRQVCLLI